MSPEQIQELLDAAKPSVIEGIKKELTQSISWEAKSQAIELVRKHVQEWVSKEIIPEITAQLVESKDGLIAAAVKVGPAIVDEIVASATAHLKEKLEKSWDRKKILQAIFE